MFGLFKNKKENDSEHTHPEYIQLIDKWDAFLSKIETRFSEMLVNAEEALLENLVESNYDINPTLRAWSGIKSQLMALADKIDETFEHKVEPQMLEYAKSWVVIDQDNKGTQLRESIFSRLERFQIILEGKISERFYEHAYHFLNENFNCTQCGATLDIKKEIFRSHYVSCHYCNTVNTFTPNDKISQIRWIADNIARYRAISEWDQMKKSEADYHDIPCKAEHEDQGENIAAFEEREKKERAFWNRYFEERSSILPEHKESLDHDVEVKMSYLYEERKREFNF